MYVLEIFWYSLLTNLMFFEKNIAYVHQANQSKLKEPRNLC